MKTSFLFLLIVCSFPLWALEELVQKKEFRLKSYTSVDGEIIKNLTVGYETYGQLNSDKSNAILITHYFTGNSHAAGKYRPMDSAPGYWDSIIGPGRPFDTGKYFIISVDTLVNVGVKDPFVKTTGPMSIDPLTKKPYGLKFPWVRLTDSIHVQKKLLETLGIQKLIAVAGASSGAAQAIEWSVRFPDMVPKVVAVVPPALKLPDYVVALLNRWIAPIMIDPNWNQGNYYGKKASPQKGLIESLKLITLSSVYLDWGPKDPSKIESVLQERAEKRAQVADANSIIYTARAIQRYDVEEKAADIKAEFLFVPAEKDMIFPVEIAEGARDKLCFLGKTAEVVVLKGRGGHLDGLTEIAKVSGELKEFLERPLGKKKCH